MFDGFLNNAKLQSIIQALLLNIAQFREKKHVFQNNNFFLN